MHNENRFFDDMAKIFNGVASNVTGASREAESAMRARAKDWMKRMDFVSREEFEAVKAMAEQARVANATLAKRLELLEGHATKTSATAATKTASQKTGKTVTKAASGRTTKNAATKIKTSGG